MNDTLYQELLMDHYKYPRNRGALPSYDFTSCDDNPSCGDRVCFFGIVENNRLSKISFEGKGCIISQAIASMLTEECMQKSCEEVTELSKEKICSMVGIHLGPNRIKCALLPLFVLQEGVKKCMKGNS